MKLQIKLKHQIQALLTPLFLHGLGLFIFSLVFFTNSIEAPKIFQLIVYASFAFSFLCLLITHVNYYLYERKRSYRFEENNFIITLNDKDFHYNHDDVSYIKIIKGGYEMYDYRRFEMRRYTFFFPSYYFIEIILNNGNRIPITCFADSNLEFLIKKIFSNINHVEDLKAIPII